MKENTKTLKEIIPKLDNLTLEDLNTLTWCIEDVILDKTLNEKEI